MEQSLKNKTKIYSELSFFILLINIIAVIVGMIYFAFKVKNAIIHIILSFYLIPLLIIYVNFYKVYKDENYYYLKKYYSKKIIRIKVNEASILKYSNLSFMNNIGYIKHNDDSYYFNISYRKRNKI